MLDISDGEGACFTLSGGTEVTHPQLPHGRLHGVRRAGQGRLHQHPRLDLHLGLRPEALQRRHHRRHGAGAGRELPRQPDVGRVLRVRRPQPGKREARPIAFPMDHLPALLGHRLRAQRLQRRDVRHREHQRAALPHRGRGRLLVGRRLAVRQVHRQLRAEFGHGGDGQPRPRESRRDLPRPRRRAAHHRRQRLREQHALRRLRHPLRRRARRR